MKEKEARAKFRQVGVTAAGGAGRGAPVPGDEGLIAGCGSGLSKDLGAWLKAGWG